MAQAAQLALATAGILAAAAVSSPPTRSHVGHWASIPLWTPSCWNGYYPDSGDDPSRVFCCDPRDVPTCPAEFVAEVPTPPPVNYTTLGRRDYHHVPDGPLVGNGNIGVVAGSGNVWNISHPWVDFFVTTNSFWALTGQGHSEGKPFRGRLSLPGAMQLGVQRLHLPASFAGAAYSAVQDVDSAYIQVNLTSQAGVTVSATLFVSPLAPVFYTTITVHGSSSPLTLSLNTSVKDRFYERENNGYNTSYAMATTAACSGQSTSMVTRDSEFAEAPSNTSITGAISSTVLGGGGGGGSGGSSSSKGGGGSGGSAACVTGGQTSATLTFSASAAAPTTVASVVRTTKDPSCVALPKLGTPPLCGLSTTDSAAAAALVVKSAAGITLEEAAADHAQSWAAFWNVSSISLPDAPETEDFWFGAQYVANSAIPHEGQEQTPPGLYGPWSTIDNPGWHGDFTIDYNYEAIFYGVMSSNHPEMMRSYPNPMLSYAPLAAEYAATKSKLILGHACPGLHFPDVLAPWGFQEGADGLTEDAGLNSNGPYSNMPLVWAWEYGDRENLAEIKEKWFPLIKGEARLSPPSGAFHKSRNPPQRSVIPHCAPHCGARTASWMTNRWGGAFCFFAMQADFFSCFLQANVSSNVTDGYLHDPRDCTNESPAPCSSFDTVMTLSMMRRSFDVVSDMAEAVGEPVDPKWAATLERVAPTSTLVGWMHIDDPTMHAPTPGMSNETTHMCTWCAWKQDDKTRTPTVGDCSQPGNKNGALNGAQCAYADKATGKCPAGMGPCSQQAFGSKRNADGSLGMPSGGNSQSIFPAFPADAVGSNSSLTAAAAATNVFSKSWSQGNSFTKACSAAARTVAPGFLRAEDVYAKWLATLTATQQPNFIPFNGLSGFETVGATEYVNYMLLQSDPGDGDGRGRFLGLFEAWPVIQPLLGSWDTFQGPSQAQMRHSAC